MKHLLLIPTTWLRLVVQSRSLLFCWKSAPLCVYQQRPFVTETCMLTDIVFKMIAYNLGATK